MGIPADKAELLLAIETNFGKLLKALQAVPEGLTQEPVMEGHSKDTRMSVANLVAYLIGWNELVIKWIERDAAGLPVDFPETGFKWNELGGLAHKFYRDYEGLTYPQLLTRLMAARARIVELIGQHSDDELYGRPWYERWSLGRMIQFNTASPYHNANGRLRKWLKSEGVKL
ncbi:ClbS/DfsB family four-helix bundle protein [Aeromonas hydrophila]|jgi:hypothetical protein|uniref:ClbS/DfsB family four-helix bundle protein n=1 Tax=Aeromonas hydrophila TaxID=644 RepID=UPI003EC6E135